MPIKHFNRGRNSKPQATRAFEEIVANHPHLDGEVIYGYPLYRYPEGLHVVDAVLVSETGHVTVVDLIEDADLSGYRERQDNSYNLVDLRLRQNPDFRHRRSLLVPIQTVSYGPELTEPDDDPEYTVATNNTLAEFLISRRRSAIPHPARSRENVIMQIYAAF